MATSFETILTDLRKPDTEPLESDAEPTARGAELTGRPLNSTDAQRYEPTMINVEDEEWLQEICSWPQSPPSKKQKTSDERLEVVEPSHVFNILVVPAMVRNKAIMATVSSLRIPAEILSMPLTMERLERLASISPTAIYLQVTKQRLANLVLTHCKAAIATRCVNSEICNSFKLGLTCDPASRWTDEIYGYRQLNFSSMTIVAILQTGEAAAYLEAALISEYVTSPKCLNKALGGEGNTHNPGPYFVYFVINASSQT